ncbi:Proteasome subunit beta type-7 [Coniosporium apollinis]|uniref:Proteasome subunit beta type-7 n=1 Tax=Coniosporium apollinis TaxID=61459 RepID=A0ABQ9NK51_9PEZI|nr:Proteasome subunit beta type-7 [Coniosporium apollinis]
MNHLPQAWGRPRDDIYGAYNHAHLAPSHPTTHTQSPIVTGTSVIALKFRGGVVIAADNLASYGSLARFTDVKRLRKFNDKAVLGFGGDVSDMQYLDRHLNALAIRENYSSGSGAGEKASSTSTDASEEERAESLDNEGAGTGMAANNLHKYLQKLLYRRRSDFNPLWNHILIAGLSSPPPNAPDASPQPFLKSVDLLGTAFGAPSLATGFGAHLAQPILRRVVPDEEAVKKIDEATAVEAIRECMKVLWYRDARSLDRYSLAVVTKEGVRLSEDERVEGQSWEFAEGIRGYGTQVV